MNIGGTHDLQNAIYYFNNIKHKKIWERRKNHFHLQKKKLIVIYKNLLQLQPPRISSILPKLCKNPNLKQREQMCSITLANLLQSLKNDSTKS